jgi:hypothetical protein
MRFYKYAAPTALLEQAAHFRRNISVKAMQ